MSNETMLTRRALFTKIGILLNGLVAGALSVPIARFLLSSITQGRADGYLSWVSLGGAYYRDGARASGPPERGLFEYPYEARDGQLSIHAGELPTPGPNAAVIKREPPCA
jgi:hypothetical protein